MTTLGPIRRFLGVEYSTIVDGLLLHQTSYAYDMLTQFQMEASHLSYILINEGTKLHKNKGTRPCDTLLYGALIGQLHWLTKTRSDFAFAVGLCSRYTNAP